MTKPAEESLEATADHRLSQAIVKCSPGRDSALAISVGQGQSIDGANGDSSSWDRTALHGLRTSRGRTKSTDFSPQPFDLHPIPVSTQLISTKCAPSSMAVCRKRPPSGLKTMHTDPAKVQGLQGEIQTPEAVLLLGSHQIIRAHKGIRRETPSNIDRVFTNRAVNH